MAAFVVVVIDLIKVVVVIAIVAFVVLFPVFTLSFSHVTFPLVKFVLAHFQSNALNINVLHRVLPSHVSQVEYLIAFEIYPTNKNKF